ncbi:MAG: Rrf2 family transcriptional regulator [Calditrichaeota bacterium]|nr:MAG: Rrf2 family transcriptional regulator [Calditrichota bacterium]
MLKFNKKVEYAIIALLYMSDKPAGELTTTRELSANFSIPQEILGKVLQSLARQQLIASIQGVRGGYYLNMPLEKITINRVITAIEGPVQIVNCVETSADCDCEQLAHCNIRDYMQNLHTLIINFFSAISLKDLKTHLPHVIQTNPFLKAVVFYKGGVRPESLGQLVVDLDETS